MFRTVNYFVPTKKHSKNFVLPKPGTNRINNNGELQKLGLRDGWFP